MAMSDDDGNSKGYRVGYGKPPEEFQFKKGQPQEFRRRSKRKPTRREVLARVSDEQVTVSEKGRSRKVSADEAILLLIRNRALNGDSKAQEKWFNFIRKELDQIERDSQVKEYESYEIGKELRKKIEDMAARYEAQEAAKMKRDDEAAGRNDKP
jgi:Family of unknown function (DUF5681)